MPAKRLPMRKIKDVLRLRWGLGLTSRQAAASLGLARSTVAEYVRRAEEAGLSWPLLEDCDDFILERRLFPAPLLIAAADHRVALDVLIQILVRIQVRPVPRKIKQSDPSSFRSQPLLHRSRPVDGMTIHDEINPARHLPLQSSQKIDEHPGPKFLVQNDEIQLAAVRDRRNHPAAEPLSRPRDHRRLPFQPPTCPRRMIRPEPHLVSPVNLRFIPPCQGLDHRIFLLQALLDRFRIRFERPPDRLLRCETPLPQVPPHRPNQKTRPISLFDQSSHSLSRPQVKRQPQLVGRLVGDRLRDHLGLTGRKSFSFGPTLRFRGQNIQAELLRKNWTGGISGF